MIAISVPYATDEITHYITTGEPALSAASAGYIVLVVAQVCVEKVCDDKSFAND